MTAAIRRLTRQEFLGLFDNGGIAIAAIGLLRQYPDAVALVRFENLAFDSSQYGRATVVVVGPSNTFKSVEGCAGKWLNDLPSQRQYPVAYVTRADFFYEVA